MSERYEDPLVIHHLLDDYGLDPYAFRVYAHIVRRAKKNRFYYGSIKESAAICRISQSVYRRSLRILTDLGIITMHARPGYANAYKLQPSRRWKRPLSEMTPLSDMTPPLSDMTDEEEHLKEEHLKESFSSAFADGSGEPETVGEERTSKPEGVSASPMGSSSPTERARAIKKAKQEALRSRFLELREAWNENCGSLPKMTAVNAKRERYFRNLIQEAEAAGIDPVLAMSVVAATVAQNDYYQQKRFNVEHALSDGKWLKHYETGVAKGYGPQEAIAHGFTMGQLVRWLIDPRFPKQGHNMGVFRGVNERGLAQVECEAGDTTVIRTPRVDLLEAADA